MLAEDQILAELCEIEFLFAHHSVTSLPFWIQGKMAIIDTATLSTNVELMKNLFNVHPTLFEKLADKLKVTQIQQYLSEEYV